MNQSNNSEIVAELKRLRRSNQRLCYLVLVLVIMELLFTPFFRNRARTTTSHENPWTELAAAVNRFDYAKGLSLAKDIVAQNPNDYYSHSYIARVYLATGDLTNAEAHYLRAFELWPNEENEKSLAAIRNRLNRERSKPLLSK